MGVLRVTEKFAQRSGGFEVGAGVVRRYTREFEVFTDNPLDGPVIACLAATIPRVWDTYSTPNESDTGAYCKRVWATQRANTRDVWEVQCDYNSEFDSSNPTAQAHPLDRAPRLNWRAVHFREPFVEDKDGEPVANSAGDRFGPDVEIDSDHMMLTITRNEETFDEDAAADYINAINDSSYRGKPKYTWKINDISADYTSEAIVDADGNPAVQTYYVVTYQLEYNKKEWLVKILDQGFNKLVGATKEKLLDENEQPFSDPQNLDGSGDVLTPGTAAHVLEFHGYDELPFDLLELPG